MTHEEKINYMKIAAGICGYGFDTKGLDLMVSLYELVIEKQGDSDLRSISKIEAEVKHRADVKSRSELLDKVSEKVG
jgi:hypothetical protein